MSALKIFRFRSPHADDLGRRRPLDTMESEKTTTNGSRNTPERDADFELLRSLVNQLRGPYAAFQQEAVQRVIRTPDLRDEPRSPLRLSHTANSVNPHPQTEEDAAQKMLRAAVVLTHTYLEDYLRTIDDRPQPPRSHHRGARDKEGVSRWSPSQSP